MEAFEKWLLRRVGQAVEARKVSADLLTELQAEFQSSRKNRQEQSCAGAAGGIAAELGMPLEKVEAWLAAVEAQLRVNREVFLRGSLRCGWRHSRRHIG